jgi:hypothetical protein
MLLRSSRCAISSVFVARERDRALGALPERGRVSVVTLAEHRVLAPVDQGAGLGGEPLRLSIRKETVLRRRVVDKDVVAEGAGWFAGAHVDLRGLRFGRQS